MSLTYLWTDIMVWILIFSLSAWGWIVSRSPQVKKQWQTIFKSSVVMVVLIGIV